MGEGSGSVFPISEGTLIIIRTSSDLFLSGGDQAEVRFFGSEDRVQIRQEEGMFRIENHSGMDLIVPRGANVRVERVGGSAFMQDLGMIEVQKVGGEMALQRVGHVEIGKVGGGLTAREVNGPFRVQRVGGDLDARELGGPVSVDNVGGEADVQAAGDEEFLMRTGGDALVYLTRSTGRLVSLRAGGEISLYLPAHVDARIEVVSDGEMIDLRLNRQTEQRMTEIDARRHEFTLGEGSGRVEVRSGGECLISDEPVEPSSLSSEFERLETSWQNARENRARFGWPGHFDPERSQAWAEMIGKRAQEAARRAEMRAQAVSRRVEEQARRSVEREMRHGKWGEVNVNIPDFSNFNPFGNQGSPFPPQPPQPSPVSEQERLIVLQMLQEGKITVEQAESLLRALEGKYKEK